MNKSNAKIKKQGGIVVLATISYILSIYLSFNSVKSMIYPFSFDTRWQEISNLAISSYNKQWVNFVYFTQIANILVLIMSIILIVLFTKQSKYITNALIIFFMFRIVILTLTFYFQTVIKGPATPQVLEIASYILRALVIPGLWIPYLMLSEKIRETFIY